MPTALRKPWVSPEQYLAAERTAETRHEYVDGEVFAMVGASRRHASIVANIGYAIREAARRRGRDAYLNDVKVRVEAANAYIPTWSLPVIRTTRTHTSSHSLR